MKLAPYKFEISLTQPEMEQITRMSRQFRLGEEELLRVLIFETGLLADEGDGGESPRLDLRG